MDRAELEDWFGISHAGDLDGTYRHTWCRQAERGRWYRHLPNLIAYLERAHEDARQLFQSSFGLDLDPVAPRHGRPSYPSDLPLKTKKGYFGEALCGMMAEGIEIIGRDRWVVPAFLFRLHQEAEEYLFRLVLGAKVPRDIPGRTGSDFVALCLGEDGQIRKFLVGEAKCHEVFNATKCKEALAKLGDEGPTPVSLPQLKRIVQDRGGEGSDRVIAAIENVIFHQRFDSIPRTNLFLYLFDRPGVATYDSVRITEEVRDAGYKCPMPLHVFEVWIPDGSELVRTAYDRVYRGMADVAV